MPETVYQTAGLTFAYDGAPVLSGLDLTILAGRFYGIVGPNGCGKTTLLDLLTGGHRPAAGSIRLWNRELGSYASPELARRLSLVPQEFAINFPFTVYETVLMGRHPHIPRFASPAARDLAMVDEALDLVEMSHMAEKPVTELSGGEKQRVVLARALAQDAPLMLLDEPTSNLDVNHSLAVLRVVESRVRAGATVVAVMHDLNLAAAFCDHLVFMKEGRVLSSGPTGEVLDGGTLAQVFGVAALVRWDEFAGSRVVVFRKEEGRA
ncbi:MAG: ABC transporter ATP-binding protein [Deltaproteobacteria bacterium]|nr:ABC transporter ATP-binding protein [Deltaproteobacteria bacterium]